MECIVKFFERVYGIKMDPESKYGYVIVNKNLNVKGRKEVIDTRINDTNINNSSFEDVLQDAFNKMGIKEDAYELISETIEKRLCFCMENCPSDFIMSLYKFYSERGYLSEKQAQVLERIYLENINRYHGGNYGGFSR